MVTQTTDTFQPSILSLGTTRAPKSWPELLIAEPRLRQLADSIREGLFTDWSEVKPIMRRFVGWYATRRELGSETLYELASRELNRLLARRRAVKR